MKGSPPGTPVPASSVTSVPSQCKRVNSDSSINMNENSPLTILNKRQRTKSGSDPVDPSVNCVSLDFFNGKCDLATPLSERNNQTVKVEGSLPLVSLGDNACSKGVSSDSMSDKSKVDSSSSTIDELRETSSIGCCSQWENNVNNSSKRTVQSNSDGGLSPHCAATLEYVSRLPEGCSVNSFSASVSSVMDGEFSDEEIEDDDNYLDSSDPEDALDNCLSALNEDEESCCEDDQSVISTITVGSTSSLRSIASEAISTICINENGVASNEDGSLLYKSNTSCAPLPALTLSLFPNVSPTINFCQYNESTEQFPEAVGKLLKWRFTTITPLIVRKTIINSGFKITKKTMLWCGTWGKQMKSPCFKGIKDFQKINHFPGTFQIGRKDKLWKNFSRLQSKYGKEEFGFIPKTFVLPGDLSALKSAFDKEGVKKKWIVKPPASARGTGIQVVNKWSQMPVDTPVVVQRYISRPYLINDTKCDIRIYVLVTSFHPLNIFLYQDGLVRFASVQYQSASKTLGDRFMHLTNYSVNKTSSSYTHNEDAGQCQGHKWTLRALWGYLKTKDVDTGALWSRIADLVIKTVVSGEQDIVVRTRRNTKSRYSCYELYGIDVILDERLRPWLLEVNISPSLHSASPLDHSVKGPLIADLLNLVGFHIPDKLVEECQLETLQDLKLEDKVATLCLDRRMYTRLLTNDEQGKHIKINSMSRSSYLVSAIENLTPDDVRHLLTHEDQLQRAGKFTCIFPTPDTHQYFGFIERPRYYNRLLDAWETAYSSCRETGIELLKSLCEEKVHLKVPQKFKTPKVACGTSEKRGVRQPPSHSVIQPLGNVLPKNSTLTTTVEKKRIQAPTTVEGHQCKKGISRLQTSDITDACHSSPSTWNNRCPVPSASLKSSGLVEISNSHKSQGSQNKVSALKFKTRRLKKTRVSVLAQPLKPALVRSVLNVACIGRGNDNDDSCSDEWYAEEDSEDENIDAKSDIVFTDERELLVKFSEKPIVENTSNKVPSLNEECEKSSLDHIVRNGSDLNS